MKNGNLNRNNTKNPEEDSGDHYIDNSYWSIAKNVLFICLILASIPGSLYVIGAVKNTFNGVGNFSSCVASCSGEGYSPSPSDKEQIARVCQIAKNQCGNMCLTAQMTDDQLEEQIVHFEKMKRNKSTKNWERYQELKYIELSKEIAELLKEEKKQTQREEIAKVKEKIAPIKASKLSSDIQKSVNVCRVECKECEKMGACIKKEPSCDCVVQCVQCIANNQKVFDEVLIVLKK